MKKIVNNYLFLWYNVLRIGEAHGIRCIRRKEMG